MKKRLPLFATHLCVRIAEHKTDSCEEITLPRSIASDNNIVFWRERLDDCLIFVAVTRLSATVIRSKCDNERHTS